MSTRPIPPAALFGGQPMDEGSSIRERETEVASARRLASLSLTLQERLELKLAQAGAMLARLEPQVARARLLQVAMLRRDEALLDGILAELAGPHPPFN